MKRRLNLKMLFGLILTVICMLALITLVVINCVEVINVKEHYTDKVVAEVVGVRVTHSDEITKFNTVSAVTNRYLILGYSFNKSEYSFEVNIDDSLDLKLRYWNGGLNVGSKMVLLLNPENPNDRAFPPLLTNGWYVLLTLIVGIVGGFFIIGFSSSLFQEIDIKAAHPQPES